MVNINLNLPKLTPEMKQKLISIADNYPRKHKENVLTYLVRGEITIDEMPLLNNIPDIKNWLVQQYDEWLHQPDPKEQEDWKRIQGLQANPAASMTESPVLKSLLEQYLEAYGTSKPEGNHLDEAKSYLDKINKEQERAAWDNVNVLSYDSLIRYYNSHKDTPYFNDLDDNLWALVNTSPVNVNLVKRFMADMPHSSYFHEAERIEKGFSDWEKVRDNNNVFEVKQYIKEHPDSEFYDNAMELMENLKRTYLKDFKSNMAAKTLEDYNEAIRSGIYTPYDFQDAGIVTAESLKKLEEKDEYNTNVEYTDYEESTIECPLKHTDVYLFGIPSTGKTCVLMGLLNSEYFDWNPVRYGGKTGQQLQQLCDMGLPPIRTVNKLMTFINGTINDSSDGIVHPVNIIDMSGEDFAFKISNTPEAKVSFEDMGKGVPELLNNENDKVFFITIDPTDEFAIIKRQDETGNYINTKISQKLTLQSFISILADKDNAGIMQKVKAIHIIATKADCLSGHREERQEIAKKIISDKYKLSMKKLVALCDKEKYDINISSDNEPLLFDFSLGSFYMGGIYEYDSTDSDKLIKVISDISAGSKKHKSKWEKLKDWFND